MVLTDEIRTYLLNYLSIADPCLGSSMNQEIDLFWELAGYTAPCNDLELIFYNVQRESIKYLMGCDVWNVDYRSRQSILTVRGKSEGRQDGWSQAQNTTQATDFSDHIGQSRYNDFSDASMDSGSTRDAWSESHDKSGACMHDVGYGESVSDSHAVRFSHATREAKSASRDRGQGRSSGTRTGCNYQYSAGKGNGEVRGSSGIGIGWGSNHTGRKTGWTMYTHSETETDDKHDSVGFRENRSQAHSDTQNTSQRQSGSYFNAHIDDSSWSTHSAHGEEHSQSFRDSRSHAEGLGQSANESKAQSENSNQATSQSHSDGEQHRLTERSSSLNMDSEALHQRFSNLKRIYDQLSDKIKRRTAVLLAQGKPAAGISTICSDRISLAFLQEPCVGTSACGGLGSQGACLPSGPIANRFN